MNAYRLACQVRSGEVAGWEAVGVIRNTARITGADERIALAQLVEYLAEFLQLPPNPVVSGHGAAPVRDGEGEHQCSRRVWQGDAPRPAPERPAEPQQRDRPDVEIRPIQAVNSGAAKGDWFPAALLRLERDLMRFERGEDMP